VELGYIDYLNCYPYYYEMFEKRPLQGIRIIPAYPRELNRMMRDGELALSPISSAAFSTIDDRAVLLPQFCLSSIGYVGSVVLRSKIPIEDLHQKRVGLTRASETSVVLLKVLLQHYYHLQPRYSATEPNPYLHDLDAALLIGNEAMAPVHEPVSFSYDLGELWLRKTGFPVVFAVFAAQESVLSSYRYEIDAVIQSYGRSLACLETERAAVIAAAEMRYPNIPYDLDEYFRTLHYTFTPELRKALAFYYSIAGELGFLKQRTAMRFLDES